MVNLKVVQVMEGERHGVHFKPHLHKGYILEESTPLWHWIKHAASFFGLHFIQGWFHSSLWSSRKKAHNFNTDNSSNGLLDK
jgi:hypothetical protein